MFTLGGRVTASFGRLFVLKFRQCTETLIQAGPRVYLGFLLQSYLCSISCLSFFMGDKMRDSIELAG